MEYLQMTTSAGPVPQERVLRFIAAVDDVPTVRSWAVDELKVVAAQNEALQKQFEATATNIETLVKQSAEIKAAGKDPGTTALLKVKVAAAQEKKRQIQTALGVEPGCREACSNEQLLCEFNCNKSEDLQCTTSCQAKAWDCSSKCGGS
jgi:hypothetical protein